MFHKVTQKVTLGNLMEPYVTFAMKIDVNNIPPEGLFLAEDIDASSLNLDTDMFKFRKPVQVKAQAHRITNAVSVDLNLTTSMYTNCSRCLNEFEIPMNKTLKLTYQVNKLELVIDTSTSSFDKLRTNPERAKRVEGSLECHGERSRTIDLNPDIRQEIILDYPMKPLCMPDCKGLCPKCGKNLNEGDCSCGLTEKKTF